MDKPHATHMATCTHPHSAMPEFLLPPTAVHDLNRASNISLRVPVVKIFPKMNRIDEHLELPSRPWMDRERRPRDEHLELPFRRSGRGRHRSVAPHGPGFSTPAAHRRKAMQGGRRVNGAFRYFVSIIVGIGDASLVLHSNSS